MHVRSRSLAGDPQCKCAHNFHGKCPTRACTEHARKRSRCSLNAARDTLTFNATAKSSVHVHRPTSGTGAVIDNVWQRDIEKGCEGVAVCATFNHRDQIDGWMRYHMHHANVTHFYLWDDDKEKPAPFSGLAALREAGV